MKRNTIDKLLNKLCTCGHTWLKHAEFAGLGCGVCDSCQGWEKECTCEARVLLWHGCQC